MARGATKNKKTSTRGATKLEKMGLEKSSLSLKELRHHVRQCKKASDEGNWTAAARHSLIAWEAMPDDLAILTILANALAQLGVREKAIAVIERALTVHAPTYELCAIIQNLALNMDMMEISEKIGLQMVAMKPDNPEAYINLATSMSALDKLDETIALLQEVLPVFPENAGLWNMLAAVVMKRDGAEAADVFFEEAIKYNPKDFKSLNNYGQSKLIQLKHDEALALQLRAIEAEPDSPEPRLGVSLLQFMKGDMEEGLENYEARLDNRRSIQQAQHFTHGLPLWQGEELKGKTILLAAEQGIGDEALFASFFHRFEESGANLAIGCDVRLVSVFERSFPGADVCYYRDWVNEGYRYRIFPGFEKRMKEGEMEIDYYLPIASSLKQFYPVNNRIPVPVKAPWEANSVLVKEITSQLSSISNKPKIGLAWRSGLMSASRRHHYNSFENMAPIWALSDKVDFINLQYGDVQAELEALEKEQGVKIHQLEGIDLKQDIEANLAIMACCDLVVSSCSAPGMFSAVSGCPTIFMSWGMPWWTFGHDGGVPWALRAETVIADYESGWGDASAKIATRIKEKLKI